MFLAPLGPVRRPDMPADLFAGFEPPSHRGGAARGRAERREGASEGIRGGGVGTKCRTPQPDYITGDLHNCQQQEKTLNEGEGFPSY